MKKLFVVSDVHGFYYPMIKALNDAGFDSDNEDHIFVSCGDLLDRGTEANQCLEFVNSLKRKILIRGNHEDLLEQCIARGEFRAHDIHNGTFATCIQLSGFKNNDPLLESDSNILNAVSSNEAWNTYINSVINYYEVGNYIFVHGWIPVYRDKDYKYVVYENWRTLSDDYWDNAKWSDARWVNCFEAYLDRAVEKDKTIIAGHWHCSYGHSIISNDGREFGPTANFTPYYGVGMIGIDACTAISGKVNCIVLEVEDEIKE